MLLNDGSKYEGLIEDNKFTGIVSIQNRKDSSFRSVRSSLIQGMEYFDRGRNIQRKFISLETVDATHKTKDIFLYEIIKEFDDFAILSFYEEKDVIQNRNDQITIPSANGVYSTANWNGGEISVTHGETFCFLNKEGEREIFASISITEVNGLRSKSKTIAKRNVLIKYFGESRWEEALSYIKQKGLNLNDGEAILEAIDYISLN